MEYRLNPENERVPFSVGTDIDYRWEEKQRQDDIKIADSGGTTILAGPTFKIGSRESLSFELGFFYPVYQDLGGVHQELKYESTAAVQFHW